MFFLCCCCLLLLMKNEMKKFFCCVRKNIKSFVLKVWVSEGKRKWWRDEFYSKQASTKRQGIKLLNLLSFIDFHKKIFTIFIFIFLLFMLLILLLVCYCCCCCWCLKEKSCFKHNIYDYYTSTTTTTTISWEKMRNWVHEKSIYMMQKAL